MAVNPNGIIKGFDILKYKPISMFVVNDIKPVNETFSFITPAFDGIHFDNVKVRMCLHEAFKINIGTFVTIHLLKILTLSWLRFFLAFLVTNATGQINVTSLKYTLIQIIVKGSSTNRNLIGMYCKDVT